MRSGKKVREKGIMKTSLTNRAFDLCFLLAFGLAFWPSAVQAQTCTASISTASSPAAGGSTSGGGTVNCGSNATVCAIANSCYSFVYWSLNGNAVSTSNCYTFATTTNETLVANFVNGQGALATDNAADPAYSGGWTNGQTGGNGGNGGTGFGPWLLMLTSTSMNGGTLNTCNGLGIGSSTNLMPFDSSNFPFLPPGIDIGGKSWFLYANNVECGSPEITTAYRAFADGPVQVGDKLLLDMDNGLNDVGGSSVGFTLRNGDATNSPADYGTGARLQFNLAGGSNDYTVVDAAGARDSGVPLTHTGLHLIFTPGTNDSYMLTIIAYGSGSTNTFSGTLGGTPNSTLDSIALFNNDNGTNGPHNVYFNSLSVVYSTPTTYAISTSSLPAGGGTTSGGGIVNCGSNVTVTATATNSCYSFVNWTESGTNVSANANYTFTASANRTLAANFSLNSYIITTGSSPAGGGITSGGGTKPCGTNVTVNATPNTCYQFVSWMEGTNVVSTSSNYTFTVSSNSTLVANFSQLSYAINTSSSPLAGGSTSGGGVVNCGSNVCVTATPNTCYQFVNWTEGPNIVSTSTMYCFTAGANRSLVANFAAVAFSISPVGATHGAAGGQGAIFVTASGGCSWTAVNNVFWTSITSSNSGTGNGSVTYSVLSNFNVNARMGTLTVAGQTYTVTQNGAIDSVGDGISDWWRQKYFGGNGMATNSKSCALCDADGTGQDNLFKFVAGLDPTNRASVFLLNIANVTGQPNEKNLVFSPVFVDRIYTPLFSTDLPLDNWQTLTGTTESDLGNQRTITDPSATQGAEFYIIQITWP
jgi:List-Bact-rpt repeat protein